MAFLIQHGHGKGAKIETALSEGYADGVIVGARHEQPDNLVRFINEISEQHECERLIDPQFFVAALAPANDGHLPEYDYFEPGLTGASFTLRKMRTFARKTLEFQARANVTSLISPSVIFHSFNDRWYQIALNLADASLEAHSRLSDGPPLLLSFHISEQALSSHDDVSRFLDTITQDDWTMRGFYINVVRDGGEYDCCFEPDRLANLLYIANALGTVNEVEAIFGYADFCGALLRAAGATAFAGGWHQSQRRFVRAKFLQAKKGGQQPRPRYASAPLLNSIFLSELEQIHDVGFLDEVLSDVQADETIREAPESMRENWNQAIQFQQHFQTLKALDTAVRGQPRSDLRRLLKKIDEAEGLYATLEGSGVDFDTLTGSSHLSNWREAIELFAAEAGMDLGK